MSFIDEQLNLRSKSTRCMLVPCTQKLYDVLLDDVEIETLVTYDSYMATAWVDNTELHHGCRLHRLIVGLDIEWRPNFNNNIEHPVATLQLCVGKSCLIFQILRADKIPRRLREFLGNSDYTFVGVGIEGDVRKLRNDYGLEVAKTRDLGSWAGDELGRADLRYVGLKALAKEVVGVEIEKPQNVRLSRWDYHVLTEAQVTYACLDAYLSFEIGRRLSAWYEIDR
ncbi:hypothetical protein DH2020_016529 [Rehmannia glutinosa]|uniref:3'-5' exonuclease domain-containing protein n=1 Tax=Rehmannia glutinosa TaxID=99300 RepID=A0ABR0WPC3_REHGL